MNHKLLKKKNVVVPFILAITGFAFYFLLEEEVIKFIPTEIIKTIKLISLILMIIGLGFTFYGVISNILNKVEEKIGDLHNRFNDLDSISKNIVNLKNNNLTLEDNSNLTKIYIEWINNRNTKMLDNIHLGKLLALEPGYFDFVTHVYNEATSNIISTSVVNPLWYDSNLCKGYIAEQAKMITEKKIKFTRIFFMNDNKWQKANTFKVIKELLENGFYVKIFNPKQEHFELRDVAIIDDKFAIEADVPIEEGTKFHKGEMSGAICYYNTTSEYSSVKKYIQGITSRSDIIDFEPDNYDIKKLTDIFFS